MKGRLSFSRPAAALMLSTLVMLSGTAEAHVKWFCGVFDPLEAPASPGDVFSPTYLALLPLFVALVSAGAFVDSLLARTKLGSAAKFRGRDILGELILRVGFSAYALCLWRNLAVVMWADPSNGSILTPDLLGRGRVLAFLQLALSIIVLIPRASIVSGTGLAILYAAGVAKYGAFYMIDYLFFMGAAVYLVLSDPWLKRYTHAGIWRNAALTVSISFSLMWTAIEKFLFPQWTMSILAHHPGITAGFPVATVTTVAGFIEFSLAFYVLVGRDILVRVSILALMALFTLAMPEFGMVDVVGHISLIAIFLVLIIHGETPLQQRFRRGHSGHLASMGRVALLYVVTLGGMTLLYYGLHAVSAAV